MYGIHTELSCKTTEETAEAFVTMVKQLREDPVFGRPDLFTHVNLPLWVWVRNEAPDCKQADALRALSERIARSSAMGRGR